MKLFLQVFIAFFLQATLISFAQDYKQYLIAYYPFDNMDCNDYSGNHYDGNPVNNPTYIDKGVSGKAIHFRGKGYYIRTDGNISQIGSHVLLPNVDFTKCGELTLCMWVRFQDFSHWPSGEAYFFYGHHNYGWFGIFNHVFEYQMNGKLINSFAVGAKLWDNVVQKDFQEDYKNNWVHYALTYANNIVKGYINGEFIGQINQTMNVYGNTAALARHWWFYDGEERTSARFTGDMDEVKIFCKALTAEEIKDAMKPCLTPKATLSASNNNLCEGDTVVLSINKKFKSIFWSTGEKTDSIKVTQAGNYIVTFYDDVNCQGKETIYVNFISRPKTSIEKLPSYNFCEGDSVTLKVKDSVGNYQWSTGEKTQSIKIKQSGTYKVTFWNLVGCTSEDSATISFYPNPKAKINKYPDIELCEGDSLYLALSSKFSNILWSNGQTNDSILVKKSGKYAVSFWETPECIGTDTVDIQFISQPNSKIIKSNYFALCEGDSLTLTLEKAFLNMQWNTGENQQSIEVKKTGNYKITYWNSASCLGEDSVFVEFLSPPRNRLFPLPDNNPCEGDSVKLTTEFVYQNMLWSTGETSNEIIVKKSGKYKLSFWNDDNICKGIDSIEINFRPLPKADIISFPKPVLCDGDSISLSLNKSFDNQQWSNGSTATTTTVWKSGEYYCTYWNNGDCKNTDTIEVTFMPIPYNEIISTPKVLCVGDTCELKLKDIFPNIRWSTGETKDCIRATKSGEYSVNFWDSTNCMGTAKIQLDFVQIPKPDINVKGNDPCTTDPLELSTDGSYEEYNWYETGNNTPISTTNPAQLKKSGKYYLKVRNSNGCVGISDTLDIIYESNPEPKFALSFSSDNKELNYDSVSYSVLNCKNIEISNLTDKDITLKNPKLKLNLDYSIPQGQLPLLIPAKDKADLLVCFAPSLLGFLSDTLTLGDGCFDWSIPLVGIGSPNNYNSQTKCDIALTSKTTDIIGGYLNMNFNYIPQKELIKINIQTNNQSSSNLKYSIYNELGQLVKQEYSILNKFSSGNKNFIYETSINTEGFSNQFYIIILEYDNNIFSNKFLINH